MPFTQCLHSFVWRENVIIDSLSKLKSEFVGNEIQMNVPIAVYFASESTTDN